MSEQASFLCPDHPDVFDCPDALISFSRGNDSYGLIVHDGGSSSIAISFCPWCGTELLSRAE
jgi:hypothetical protein